MGARVIVTPGEITPASFSHPLLVEQKIAPQPQPTAIDEPKPGRAAGRRKPTRAPMPVRLSSPRLQKRASNCDRRVGHDGVRPASRRQQFQAVARPDPHRGRQRRDQRAGHDVRCLVVRGSHAGSAPPRAEAKSEAATAEAEPAAAKPDQVAASDDQPVESTAVGNRDGRNQTPTEPRSRRRPAEKAADSQHRRQERRRRKAEAADEPKATEKPGDSVTAATDARRSPPR